MVKIQKEIENRSDTSVCFRIPPDTEGSETFPEYLQAKKLFDEKRYSEALPVIQKLVNKMHAFRGLYQRQTLLYKTLLGKTLLRLNRVEDSLNMMQVVKEGSEKIVGPFHRVAIIDKIHYGRVLWQCKRYDESLNIYEEVLEVIEQGRNCDYPFGVFSPIEMLVLLKTRAALLFFVGRYYDALERYGKLLPEGEKENFSNHLEIIRIKTSMSFIYFKLELFQTAERLAKECVNRFEQGGVVMRSCREARFAKKIAGLCQIQRKNQSANAGHNSDIVNGITKLDLGTNSASDSTSEESNLNPEDLAASVEDMFRKISLM